MEPTPGPWSINSFSGEDSNGIGLTEVYAPNPEWAENASARPMISVARIALTNQEANARLIAQAPAMYDFLAQLVEDYPYAPYAPWTTARAILKEIEP